MADVTVVLFCKYPDPGRVKTRLRPVLDAELAANLHRTFLLHWSERLSRLSSGRLIICFDPPDAQPKMQLLLGPVVGPADWLPQPSGDLGTRLVAAATHVGRRHRTMLFVGADSPDVPDEHVRHAAFLVGEGAVTLGPAEDGGFWCLGLPAEVDAAALLDEIDWSSGHECSQVMARARSLGRSPLAAPAWRDVDRPADLTALVKRLRSSGVPADRRLLESLAFLPPDRLV